MENKPVEIMAGKLANWLRSGRHVSAVPHFKRFSKEIMFTRKLTDSIEVCFSIPQFAEELFTLTDRNRAFLKQWLPWLDAIQTVDDTRGFLTSQVERFSRGESLHVTIFHNGTIAGVAGFNSLDKANGIGYIGYWLGEEFTGKGIMTNVVRDLITLGEEFYDLQKIDIRCASGNLRSRAIPERLGFSHEGTLRRAERVYSEWYDHEVYAILINNKASKAEMATPSNPSD